ncbi:MAG: RsmB/NOP family class I SAM-dependent RNA methyltransferase [Sphingomonadaceae bacterium]|uniref:RsmB/NOP family class I SAM-dependent RNA methyltransferase n=1 Tax=Thermaurantiacus sp. TaxID=2820283 RepID=UPI00298F3007|nr:RsmB/NOP family class I SAM-dependent RNA methyltransferase [Thermaurantiacus sp.]MCS6985993.1 RsmB/NOP family class I SAM-dependent RNA methyltransferase [Sphingomonadaceae bacterium]MDW8414791.1 RsmB/NOP family class I SAM-dependent RNA methyltransferase [Thermaurantiacus sp.]
MTPGARLQAAIEILDRVIAAARDGGAAADAIVRRELAARRYAGSHDRRAITEWVFRAIRHCAERPPSGRAALLALIEAEEPALLAEFDGGPHAPTPPDPSEPRATSGRAPRWLIRRLEATLGRQGAAAFLAASLERAPLDLRVHRLRAPDAGAVAAQLPFATEPVRGLPVRLPWALRAPSGSPVEATSAYREGLVEVQDAGSQAVVAWCAARPGERVVDLCAGAGGKTLALGVDMAGEGRLIACDVDRERLARLHPRAERAGVAVETRLLNPPREADALQDLEGRADLVLVDAPCSGTGTWRRAPELRWRLTPRRLAAFARLQDRLLDLGARLVRPGGRLVYAVCSVLADEGPARAAAFLSRHGGWRAGERHLLDPARHGCDGFFVAIFRRHG